ncbi:MAG: hypothetical protein C4K49_06745 [Candidatus Thorarchaeota archaeon]|nr:MAG: hypothetical protein C4K49_06745 [Candidatus Thorarchaeota archaeon]
MPLKELQTALEIKDPIYGYVGLTQLEKSILDTKQSQRLRRINSPACTYLVYPGAEITAMGRLPGILRITHMFFENLSADTDEIQLARLVSMVLTLAQGPWANVMEEYLSVRGTSRRKLAELIVAKSGISDIVKESGLPLSAVKDSIERGVLVKGSHVDLTTTPINPQLIDSLMRDSYFAGVEYARLEYPRLFAQTRIIKDHVAVERGSLFTLESYLSAGVNMFEAIYFHKAVRAGELMLMRILDEAGSQLMQFSDKEIEAFLGSDDLTLRDTLLSTGSDASEEMAWANHLFHDYDKRYLVKMASERAISDEAFLRKLATPDGQYDIEREIAEEASIDPRNVYVDYPDRVSVSYHPGKYSMDDLMLFERGSRGYEFWPVTEMSLLARSLGRTLRTVRVYTTRGYRTKVKKVGDRLLESVDSAGTQLESGEHS